MSLVLTYLISWWKRRHAVPVDVSLWKCRLYRLVVVVIVFLYHWRRFDLSAQLNLLRLRPCLRCHNWINCHASQNFPGYRPSCNAPSFSVIISPSVAQETSACSSSSIEYLLVISCSTHFASSRSVQVFCQVLLWLWGWLNHVHVSSLEFFLTLHWAFYINIISARLN